MVEFLFCSTLFAYIVKSHVYDTQLKLWRQFQTVLLTQMGQKRIQTCLVPRFFTHLVKSCYTKCIAIFCCKKRDVNTLPNNNASRRIWIPINAPCNVNCLSLYRAKGCLTFCFATCQLVDIKLFDDCQQPAVFES